MCNLSAFLLVLCYELTAEEIDKHYMFACLHRVEMFTHILNLYIFTAAKLALLIVGVVSIWMYI